MYKESGTPILAKIKVIEDSGYQGMQHLHENTELPIKARKNKPLTKEAKQHNKALAKSRCLNEQVIGRLKRFKILSTRYRNRRKRFGLRMNLIAGVYNYEVNNKLGWVQ